MRSASARVPEVPTGICRERHLHFRRADAGEVVAISIDLRDEKRDELTIAPVLLDDGWGWDSRNPRKPDLGGAHKGSVAKNSTRPSASSGALSISTMAIPVVARIDAEVRGPDDFFDARFANRRSRGNDKPREFGAGCARSHQES